MKVLVTGAGGFLGQHIAKKLQEEGHEVIGLARGHYPELEEQNVKMIQGDLLNYSQVKEASLEVDAIIHSASKVAMWGKWNDFYQTNVIGTQNVLKACEENKIKTLIYTSTPSVVFGEESIKKGDESLPYPQETFSLYAKSKSMAEREVLKANSNELKTLALRPHLIFGPGDKNIIPRLVDSAKKGRLKRVGDGTNLVDVIYVENAADAHIMALKKLSSPETQESVAGEAFFIGQGPVSLWSFIDDVLKINDLPPVKKSISFNKAFMIGGLMEKGLSLVRNYSFQPPMSRFVALQLAKDHYFDHKKANQLLDWSPKVDLEKAIQTTKIIS